MEAGVVGSPIHQPVNERGDSRGRHHRPVAREERIASALREVGNALGTEFAADELYGIVTSASDEAKVQVMFAGTNCIFR